MHSSLLSSVLTALAVSSLLPTTIAQTYTSCNPLQQSNCPADPALGKSVDIDFTSGASSEFTESGAPTYDSNGAAFTIAKSGDSPSISSKWYIMFGHVDYVVKAAPGTGIVSAAILQSDCLDEIDWEWLGGDDTQAQSNYFGKGQTTTGYNRGAFHGAPNNHDEFHTYSIDWTADQIVWSIDGTTVRAMTQAQAEAGQYPQTPMYVKVGAWAGGDPSNPQGTIEWAGGPTDYSAGPFTMYLKSIHVTDYSTGSEYSYSGTSGTWQSIISSGGKINSQGDGTPVSSSAPAVTSQVTTGSAPLAFGNNGDSSTVSRTGWPWSGTATTSATTPAVTVIPTPSSSSLQPSQSGSASASSIETSGSSRSDVTPTTTQSANWSSVLEHNSYYQHVGKPIPRNINININNDGTSFCAVQQHIYWLPQHNRDPHTQPKFHHPERINLHGHDDTNGQYDNVDLHRLW
ncbi:transglycosylase [Knufia peltigerae]|uniref:chitinase n=1 Tax=Knufia peltigerae TaxID=1002370 RepID=A0AA38XR95_9EURO|nr:transglycosylase [Knufia peltigerae]